MKPTSLTTKTCATASVVHWCPFQPNVQFRTSLNRTRKNRTRKVSCDIQNLYVQPSDEHWNSHDASIDLIILCEPNFFLHVFVSQWTHACVQSKVTASWVLCGVFCKNLFHFNFKDKSFASCLVPVCLGFCKANFRNQNCNLESGKFRDAWFTFGMKNRSFVWKF